MIDEQCSALPFDEREYVYAIVCGDKFLLTVRGSNDNELTTFWGEKASIDKKTFTIGGNAYTIEREEFARNGAVYFLKKNRDLFQDMAEEVSKAIATHLEWKDDDYVKHKEIYLKGFKDGAENPFVYSSADAKMKEKIDEKLESVKDLTEDDPMFASIYALAHAQGSGLKVEKENCLFSFNEVRKMEHVHKFLMMPELELRLDIFVVSTDAALDTRVYPQKSDSDLSVLNVLSNAKIEVNDSDLNEILDDACAPRVYEPLGLLIPPADGGAILTFNDIWKSNDKFVEPLEKVKAAQCIDLHLARVLKQLYMCKGISMAETGGGAAAPAQGSKGKIKPVTLREFLGHVL